MTYLQIFTDQKQPSRSAVVKMVRRRENGGVSLPGDKTDRSDSSSDMKELVVGTAFDDNTLIILPRPVICHLGDLYAALGSSTWGELRENADAGIYAEILGQAGYGSLDEYLSELDVGRPVPGARAMALRAYAEKAGEPLPPDDEAFDPDRVIGSYADGDFPPAPQRLMLEYLPRDVVERFGDLSETIFNGTFVEFAAEERDAIVAALEHDDYTWSDDQGLIDGAQRS